MKDAKPCSRCGIVRSHHQGRPNRCNACKNVWRAEVDEHWKNRAACHPRSGYDPDLWWPSQTTQIPNPRTQLAVAICFMCPVVDECLQYALDNDERLGIWGGMTSDERYRLKKRQGVLQQCR